MARYAMVAMVSPLPGQMEAYKAWHKDQHVPEVLAVPGVISCRRFETAGSLVGAGDWTLMSFYEIDTDDLEAVITELKARLASGAVSSTPLGDPNKRVLLTWELLSEHHV